MPDEQNASGYTGRTLTEEEQQECWRKIEETKAAMMARTFAGSAQPTELQIQAGIDFAMRQLVNSRPPNPNRLTPVSPTPSAETRWVDPIPLKAPSEFYTRLVDALTGKFVGGPNSPVK